MAWPVWGRPISCILPPPIPLSTHQVADGLACVGAPWHLREIEVLNQASGAVSRFLYDDWLERTPANPGGTVTLKEVGSVVGGTKVGSWVQETTWLGLG